jgi:hypothetical protein
MKIVKLIPFFCIILTACKRQQTVDTGSQQAYAPVYAKLADLSAIATVTPQPTAKAGKIYAYGNYIFQNDLNTGIHIIDNSTQGSPQKVAFLKIPFSTEIAIKGNYLYTNSVSDLLVFNLASPQQPQLVNRVSNAFPIINQNYPPYSNVYFECPDSQKGIVVDWELKQIINPACKR